MEGDLRRVHILLSGLHRFTRPYGLCRYTANLYTCLREMPSLQVTLLLGEWQRDYYRDALGLDVTDPRIEWITLKRPGISRYGWYLWRMPKLAKRLRPDIVHALFPMPLRRRAMGVPIVTTMHDLYAYDTPEAIGFPNVYVNRWVTRRSLASSQSVVSISCYTRDRLRHWFPRLERRMELPVIYQDVRLATGGEADLRSIPEKFLLCVAQHRKNKNLDLMIEAYYLALDQGKLDAQTQLVIVGSEGAETGALRAMTEVRGGVLFLHSISDDLLVALYQRCELLLCGSSIEGFCLPVAEALLLHCRVVCSDIPILREVAGEQGTFFRLQPRSAQAVVDAMGDSLESERHRGEASKLLTGDTGEAWRALYTRVLSEAT